MVDLFDVLTYEIESYQQKGDALEQQEIEVDPLL